ncbi:AraC family transcriptional regulator [Nocardia aurantia]|uniref:HTH araC/xylS-type domain-containing protein n=1 Tax=Nocardia aurantia TaxID=2585199 RepID=A0A7K0DRL0_9NOCA|nr:helix-turn-helix domain-containing protein [Nocardia aurantia]MQY28405.1 hypothetical protein [Nocardia aurantia]
MRAVVAIPGVAAEVQVAVPAWGSPAGVSMAGFRGRADHSVEMRMVPYPALTVFIDFGSAGLILDAGGASRRGSAVVGLAPGTLRAECGREADCLQIRLSPVVAHTMLGDGADSSGAVLSLEDLWGREAGRIQERLHAAKSWDERFGLAAEVLTRRSAAGRAVDPEIGFVWRRMVANRGRVRVERLADEVGWSRKRLWARFGAQIGLTPKRAANLIRFDHVAHRLAAGHSAAAVAVESGFADQSHLHRDAMAFAGLTPAGVAGAPWLAVDDVAWSATIPGRARRR